MGVGGGRGNKAQGIAGTITHEARERPSPHQAAMTVAASATATARFAAPTVSQPQQPTFSASAWSCFLACCFLGGAGLFSCTLGSPG